MSSARAGLLYHGADEAVRACARLLVVETGNLAIHQRGDITGRLLEKARAAERQIVMGTRHAERGPVVVDHIQVGLLADPDAAAIGHAVEIGAFTRQLLEDTLKADAGAAFAVPRPEGEVDARSPAVAEHGHMRSRIAEPCDCGRVDQHFARDVEVAVAIIGMELRGDGAAFIKQQVVVIP
jgi:hypothetical protein